MPDKFHRNCWSRSPYNWEVVENLACVLPPPPSPLPSGEIGEGASVIHRRVLKKFCITLKKIVSADQNFRGSCFMSFQFSKCRCMLLISIEQLRE